MKFLRFTLNSFVLGAVTALTACTQAAEPPLDEAVGFDEAPLSAREAQPSLAFDYGTTSPPDQAATRFSFVDENGDGVTERFRAYTRLTSTARENAFRHARARQLYDAVGGEEPSTVYCSPGVSNAQQASSSGCSTSKTYTQAGSNYKFRVSAVRYFDSGTTGDPTPATGEESIEFTFSLTIEGAFSTANLSAPMSVRVPRSFDAAPNFQIEGLAFQCGDSGCRISATTDSTIKVVKYVI